MHQIIDLILHVDRHLADFIVQHGTATYGLLFSVIFAETGFVITPFLPGDSLLFAAGALSVTTTLSPILVFLVLGTAAILGDNLNYWIGRLIGERIVNAKRPILNKRYLARAHHFYEDHGPVMVVIARFVPIIRTFAPFVAGISRMDYRTYLPYSIAGGAAWVALFTFGGFFFGNIPVVKTHFSLVTLGIIIISLVPAVIEVLRSRSHGADK